MRYKLILYSFILVMIIISGLKAEKAGYSILRSVPLSAVRVSDDFWAPRIKTNHIVGLRHAFDVIEKNGQLKNFDIASGKTTGKHRGSRASDSDVYKIIEGAAYSLRIFPDTEFEAYIDRTIDRVAAAQQDNGYLSTYFIFQEPDRKWENIRKWHELYCAGHLFEAAVAYYNTTGKRKLLDTAVKLAGHIGSVFGPEKRYEVPGHQEIELAFVKLYHLTGKKQYLDLAKFFLDERGYAHGTERKPFNFRTAVKYKDKWMNRNGIKQDHIPVIEQKQVVGHAVRACYMYSAMADMVMTISAPGYREALNSLWEDAVKYKLYITGGVGSAQYHDEGFGDRYKLPNEKAYCETCAAIAFIFWNHRMNLLYGETKYMDALELALYNGFLSGVSLSGDRFFYCNRLADKGRGQRRGWYIPGCCPSNVVRFFPQIGKYIYAMDDKGIYVNLITESTVELKLKDNKIRLIQETRYPWDGRARIVIVPEKIGKFSINIRIPGWAKAGGSPLPGGLYRFASLQDNKKGKIIFKVNGTVNKAPSVNKGYSVFTREWKKGDVIELDLPMVVRRVYAHPDVEANRGRVAIMRGPVVYCLEETDNPDYFENVDTVFLPKKNKLISECQNIMGNVMVIKGSMTLKQNSTRRINFTAVPFYAWNNRGKNRMMVWIPEIHGRR